MPQKGQVYRQSHSRSSKHRFLLVIDDTPREVVAWPCNEDGDTYSKDNLVYLNRATFIELYEKVEKEK